MTTNSNNIDRPLYSISKAISEEIFEISFNLEKLAALHMINEKHILISMIEYDSGMKTFR